MEKSRQATRTPPRAGRGGEREAYRGQLTIFFGYAPGVGKTYAMLQGAHDAKGSGVDVAVGYIAPHAPPATAALLEGLACIPPVKRLRDGGEVEEFDLDAALARRPQLVLIDELAHTNADGCRHRKRYQDVKELLKAGISVYTTVDVQHIESLNDIVTSITGASVRERIPDSIFDNAHQVELVDIAPDELTQRLHRGGLWRGGAEAPGAQGLFSSEKLTALRKLAIRRCADRVNLFNRCSYHTDEHILVCLSSAPSNGRLIRTAARMAAAYRGRFSALFVESSALSVMSEADKERLRANTRLAEQLGAAIQTVYGEDISYQIAEFARLSRVSKIVIDRSGTKRRRLCGEPSLMEHLLEIAPGLDIHVIPEGPPEAQVREKKRREPADPGRSLLDGVKCVLILCMATLVGHVFAVLGFIEADIITVYILGVLITSVVTRARVYSLLSSAASVLAFNFFFIAPRFTFMAYSQGYPVTFLIMFGAALLTSSLTTKLKIQAKQAAQAAFRTKVLLDTSQLLQKAHSDAEILTITANQLVKLLSRDIVVYPRGGDGLDAPTVFPAGEEHEELLSESEKAVAAWVLQNNKPAGVTTYTLERAKCLYLPIRVKEDMVYGVVGIHSHGLPLDAFENSILLSILGECAFALENSRNAREKEQAAVLAKNEQLRANLLRAISHDLRTPLTSISGNASNLISNGAELDGATRAQIYADIYDDSMWLINLVENLLSVTRIEEGRMNLKFSPHLIEEVIAEALKHVNRKCCKHHITVEHDESLLLAKMDARLMVQVVINLVDNAIKYTPAGSHIAIRAWGQGDFIAVSVADDGPGIADEVKPRLFDMFYSGARRVADSRRSLGLGLSLCKSIVAAHGGEITVVDNRPQGAVFTFTVPVGEVALHE